MDCLSNIKQLHLFVCYGKQAKEVHHGAAAATLIMYENSQV